MAVGEEDGWRPAGRGEDGDILTALRAECQPTGTLAWGWGAEIERRGEAARGEHEEKRCVQRKELQEGNERRIGIPHGASSGKAVVLRWGRNAAPLHCQAGSAVR